MTRLPQTVNAPKQSRPLGVSVYEAGDSFPAWRAEAAAAVPGH
jgi:hypothetical protein